MNGRIFIPTMGRLDKQRTLQSIPKSLLDNVSLVCPANEVKPLERNHKVKAVACPAKGIAATRQWILDTCGTPVCTMIDDDQWFFKRIGSTVKLEPMDPADVGDLLVEMEHLALVYPMVGLSARQGNNHHEEEWIALNSRVHNHYALDVATLAKHDIRFDRMKLMEDFYVNLSLLTTGYETAKVINRCWNQSESNSAGGCSGYRDAAMQKEASFFLAESFPGIVQVVEKKTKTGWFEGGIRYDVRIQWKKAMELGKANRQLL